MGPDSFLYKLLFLLHILTIIVGFGATFVAPVLAGQARKLAPAESYAVSHAWFVTSKRLVSPFIWLAGLFGVLLVVASDELYKFSDPWVSIAFLLFFAGIALSYGLLQPAAKRMDALGEKLASGDVTPGEGGPPAEVGELQGLGKRVGMVSGLLHLIFLLLVVDMIWKPFWP